MAEFVIYHNAEKMGAWRPAPKEARIITGKQLDNVVGSRVWFVTSHGIPRTYVLCGWFTAQRIRPSGIAEYPVEIAGPWGIQFATRERPVLNGLPWFKDFLKKQGNFGFGFNPIDVSAHVRGLERAASPSR